MELGSRRIGHVDATGEFIAALTKPENEAQRVAIFGKAIVLRAEYMVIEDRFRYTLWHPDFNDIPLGESTPQYMAVITVTKTDGDAPEYAVTWEGR